MSHFEYVTVLVSIIIAFAVSEVLAGLGRLIRERNRVRFYWVHISWMALGLLAMILHWWGIWQYRSAKFEGVNDFLILLMPSLTLVLAAFVFTPKLPFQGELDLRDYYFRNRRWMFCLAAMFMIAASVLSVSVGDRPIFHPDNAIRGLGVCMVTWLAFTTYEKVHGVVVLVAWALLLLFYIQLQL